MLAAMPGPIEPEEKPNENVDRAARGPTIRQCAALRTGRLYIPATTLWYLHIAVRQKRERQDQTRASFTCRISLVRVCRGPK